MDATQRFEFFDFVRAQWGPDRAGQLMDLLPPAGVSDLVTTDQLHRAVAELERKMAEGFGAVDRRMADQMRIILVAFITLWVSGIGLMFAAVRLAG